MSHISLMFCTGDSGGRVKVRMSGDQLRVVSILLWEMVMVLNKGISCSRAQFRVHHTYFEGRMEDYWV